MDTLTWIQYGSDDKMRSEIQRILSQLKFDFSGRREPEIVGDIFRMPEKGEVLILGEDKFVFKYVKHIDFERGYWTGRDGQTWMTPQEASRLDDDDRYFLGREVFLPVNEDEISYFYGGMENGNLFLSLVYESRVKELAEGAGVPGAVS